MNHYRRQKNEEARPDPTDWTVQCSSVNSLLHLQDAFSLQHLSHSIKGKNEGNTWEARRNPNSQPSPSYSISDMG